MWSVEWRRLGSHLQIRPIYQPVARPTQLCSSRFRSALCLPTRAQVKGCICQTDRPIVEKRFHERFSFSSAKQPMFGWFASIDRRAPSRKHSGLAPCRAAHGAYGPQVCQYLTDNATRGYSFAAIAISLSMLSIRYWHFYDGIYIPHRAPFILPLCPKLGIYISPALSRISWWCCDPAPTGHHVTDANSGSIFNSMEGVAACEA